MADATTTIVYDQNIPLRIMGNGSTSFDSRIALKEEGVITTTSSGTAVDIVTAISEIKNVVLTAKNAAGAATIAAGVYMTQTSDTELTLTGTIGDASIIAYKIEGYQA